MSAFLSKVMRVEVNGGDAVANNRTKGRSNTGTYFISSSKNFDEFKEFFEGINDYELDLKDLVEYKILFKTLFFSRRNEYPGKMRDFEETCDSLLLLEKNPHVKIGLRINDNRFFMRFINNNGFVEMSLRNIIYSQLTTLVIERYESKFSFYLDINLKEIDIDEYKKEIL